jgi:hypothetical protein
MCITTPNLGTAVIDVNDFTTSEVGIMKIKNRKDDSGLCWHDTNAKFHEYLPVGL